MVQTSSFIVLTAIALGAVSTVSAIPVRPGQSGQSVPAPAPVNQAHGAQRVAQRPPGSSIPNPGAQRVENAGRPKHAQQLTGEQRVKDTLKSQNERLENMEKTDARLDMQKGHRLEEEAKAYETEAKRLQANLGAQARLGMQKYRRTLTPKPAPPPAAQNTPARPVANVARPGANGAGTPPRPNSGAANAAGTPARPNNGAANAAGAPARPNNGRPPPTPQQQLSNQRTALLTQEKKYAAEDQTKYKQFQSEADAYRKQYEKLQSEIKESEKPAYMQNIDAQNAAIKSEQGTIAQDKKLVQAARTGASSAQRPGVATRDLEDDIEFFGRDFDDEVEEFAREWDEYDARAVAAEAAPEAAPAPAMPQEGVTAPPTEVGATEQQQLPPLPAPKKHHSHPKKQRKQKKQKAMSLPRDLEGEAEAFAREWEEFITREWAALEELD